MQKAEQYTGQNKIVDLSDVTESYWTHDHVVGIVPIVDLPDEDFGFWWHPSLIPVGKNFYAIQKSVMECVHAGCSTIWIVGHREHQQIIRRSVGDFVYSTTHIIKEQRREDFAKRLGKYGKRHMIHEIPIYYVPVHPSDRDRNESLGYSIIYGAATAFDLGMVMSKWLLPKRFYVSFPCSVYDYEGLLRRKFRKSKANENFYLTYDGKTVKNDEYLGFSFTFKDLRNVYWHYKKKRKGKWKGKHDKWPIEERWNARDFTLSDFFEVLPLEGTALELDEYYDISTWEGYTRYMGSDLARRLKKPQYMKYKEAWGLVDLDHGVAPLDDK